MGWLAPPVTWRSSAALLPSMSCCLPFRVGEDRFLAFAPLLLGAVGMRLIMRCFLQ
jgi:hypothetical protein